MPQTLDCNVDRQVIPDLCSFVVCFAVTEPKIGTCVRFRGGVMAWVVSCFLTLIAALVSPTAVLHVFTGGTLLFGFVLVRTLDV